TSSTRAVRRRRRSRAGARSRSSTTSPLLQRPSERPRPAAWPFVHHRTQRRDPGMERQRLGILVGGGPAPGINSVVAAATIRARLDDVDVIGIEDGFEWLMQGDVAHVRLLTIEAVSRIHFRGGST